MAIKEKKEMFCQSREKYEAHLDELCHLLEDIVPLKFRVAYKRSKLRIFDAVVSNTNRKLPKRGKLKISGADWLAYYQTE